MKTINTVSIALICITMILSCKKKDETPTPSSPAPSAPQINPLTSIVNGSAYSTYKFNNAPHNILTGKNTGTIYYFVSGNTSQFFGTGISFNLAYGTGTYTFSSNSNDSYKAYYNGNYPNGGDTVHLFNATTGTINITQFDTMPNNISKLKATFSFITHVYKGASYTVTDGVINYEGQ